MVNGLPLTEKQNLLLIVFGLECEHVAQILNPQTIHRMAEEEYSAVIVGKALKRF